MYLHANAGLFFLFSVFSLSWCWAYFGLWGGLDWSKMESTPSHFKYQERKFILVVFKIQMLIIFLFFFFFLVVDWIRCTLSVFSFLNDNMTRPCNFVVATICTLQLCYRILQGLHHTLFCLTLNMGFTVDTIFLMYFLHLTWFISFYCRSFLW